MKSKLLLIILFFVTFTIVAEEAPIAGSGWYWDYPGITLNGKRFMDCSESYREQDGYALVEGRKLHYWLYDTISYHDGDADDIYRKYVPHWVEKMGYVIDFDRASVSDPNTSLASSVKTLMWQRDCDVSVCLNIFDERYAYVYINEYFESRSAYRTVVYPLQK